MPFHLPILILGLFAASGCTKKTKHGSCEDCNAEESRVWIYVYETDSAFTEETCILCKPLEGGVETCQAVYHWSWAEDAALRSEGPYECARQACRAEPASDDAIVPDVARILDQYDAESWDVDCSE